MFPRWAHYGLDAYFATACRMCMLRERLTPFARTEPDKSLDRSVAAARQSRGAQTKGDYALCRASTKQRRDVRSAIAAAWPHR